MCNIKTHGRVSVAKKAMWRMSVLFTGTADSLFSIPQISLGRFLSYSYILCPLYMQPYMPNLKNISPVVYEICVHENCPFSSHFSSCSHHFTKVTLSQPKTTFSWIDLFQIWLTYKTLCGLS